MIELLTVGPFGHLELASLHVYQLLWFHTLSFSIPRIVYKNIPGYISIR